MRHLSTKCDIYMHTFTYIRMCAFTNIMGTNLPTAFPVWMSKVNPGIFPHIVLKSALKQKHRQALLTFSGTFKLSLYHNWHQQEHFYIIHTGLLHFSYMHLTTMSASTKGRCRHSLSSPSLSSAFY